MKKKKNKKKNRNLKYYFALECPGIAHRSYSWIGKI